MEIFWIPKVYLSTSKAVESLYRLNPRARTEVVKNGVSISKNHCDMIFKSNINTRIYYNIYIRSDGFQEVKVRIFFLLKSKSGAPISRLYSNTPVMEIVLTQFWSDFVKKNLSLFWSSRISPNFWFPKKIGPNSSNLLLPSK